MTAAKGEGQVSAVRKKRERDNGKQRWTDTGWDQVQMRMVQYLNK